MQENEPTEEQCAKVAKDEAARIARRASKRLRLRLDYIEGEPRRPSHDRDVQLAVSTLLCHGYDLQQIVSASAGRLSVDEALNAVRQVVASELRELLPLARSSLTWPHPTRH